MAYLAMNAMVTNMSYLSSAGREGETMNKEDNVRLRSTLMRRLRALESYEDLLMSQAEELELFIEEIRLELILCEQNIRVLTADAD